jgi:hypothetical protein
MTKYKQTCAECGEELDDDDDGVEQTYTEYQCAADGRRIWSPEELLDKKRYSIPETETLTTENYHGPYLEVTNIICESCADS